MRLALAVTAALLVATLIALVKISFEYRDRDQPRYYRSAPQAVTAELEPQTASTVTNAQILAATLRFDVATLAKMDNDQLFGFIVITVILVSMLCTAIGSIIDDLGIFLQRVIHGKKR